MSSRSRMLIMITILSVVTLSGCIQVKDSPAPGCMEYIGFGPMGGCFGKTAIIDLTLEGAPECLAVEANNCNGGVIDVRNDCAQNLILGGVEILAEDYAVLDLVETEEGLFKLNQINSNFSDFIPELDQYVEITGSLGTQRINMSFIKTAALCE